jgi:hypothetical protein
MKLAAKPIITQENLDVAYSNTILSQLLSLIPRHVFTQAERAYPTERKARVFSRWNQFVSLSFIHLAARHSMRDGIRNLTVNARKLYHLGAKPVARSTFSDANKNRPAEFFQTLFGEMYKRCQAISPIHNFRFKNKLFSLDASTIKLSLEQFSWASFRENRGGIKLHALLDHDGYIPSFLEITDARKHESKIAQALTLPKGSIVVFDRGYVCYRWFVALIQAGVFFVTRQKKNMSYKVLERRPANKKLGITSDQIVQVMSGGKPLKLRRVGYRDATSGKHFVYLTSHFTLSARTIADIYKERWQIEIFFRLIKQNLKIKRFVGTSKNAVMAQIYVAMIMYLLVAFLKYTSKLGWSIQEMLQLLQMNVFKRTSLEAFFKPPDRMSKINEGYPLLELAN